MSVVAYKGGILAADSRAYGGQYQPSPGSKRKIHRLADGSRMGVCSAILGQPERYVRWFEEGADPDLWTCEKPDLRVILIKPDGKVYLGDDGLFLSGPIDCEAYAIGSGALYALGAMAHGATAEEAVRIACRFDPHCGEPVFTLTAEA